MKHILVTGGQGFIGSNLTDYLIDCGHLVTVVDYVDNGESSATAVIQQGCEEYFKEQLTSRKLSGLSDLIGSASDFHAVIHLAAIPRVGFSLVQPELVLNNNINTTIAAAQFCVANNIPLISISSSAVVWADVTRNPYAMSKQIGEEIIELYRNTFGLVATSVRLFNVYGPGEPFAGEYTTLIKQCMNALVSKTAMTVNGDGTITRDFTHVFDVAQALEIIALNGMYEPSTLQPVYEVGIGDPSQLLSVNDIVNEFVPHGLTVEYGPPRKGDALTTCANKKLIPPGWSPAFNAIEHIRGWLKDDIGVS